MTSPYTDSLDGPPPEALSPSLPPPLPKTDALEERIVTVGFGLSLLNRHFERSSQAIAPTVYESGPVFAGIYAHVEALPLAWLRSIGGFRHLGLDIEYTRSFLESQIQLTSTMVEVVETQHQIFGIDLFYRFRFFDSQWSPELKLQFGYGLTDFLFDWQPHQTPILSSVTYHYLRVGGELVVPLFKKHLHFIARGSYRPVLSLGDAQDVYGQDVTAMGGHLRTGLKGYLPYGLFVEGAFLFTYFSGNYDGQGVAPWHELQDVGTSDRFMGMTISVGYSYWR